MTMEKDFDEIIQAAYTLRRAIMKVETRARVQEIVLSKTAYNFLNMAANSYKFDKPLPISFHQTSKISYLFGIKITEGEI